MENIQTQDRIQSSWWRKHHNHIYGFATIVGLILTIVFFLFPESQYSGPITFSINQPAQHAAVGSVAIVNGTTTIKDRNIYLVVRPQATGDLYVVDGPLAIDESGQWTGQARLGDGEKGPRNRFTITALATRFPLAEGVLPSLPTDALKSDSVEVIRVK